MNKYKLDAKAIDKAIDLALEQKRLVGAVVLVALGGEQVYRRAAGMADREAGKPMRIDALFRLASVSKPILSTAALVLMAQGRLRLEDPVVRWLPSFRPRTPDGQQPLVTVRHLMTHTAGLSYRFFQPEHGSYAQAEFPTVWMTIRLAWRKMCVVLPRLLCRQHQEPNGATRLPPMCWVR